MRQRVRMAVGETLHPLGAEEYATLLNRQEPTGRVRLGDWGYEVVPQVPLLGAPVRVITETISVTDLGCAPNATWGAIMRAASRFNLTYVPPWFIVPIRFARRGHAEGNLVRIAHEPIELPDGRTFRLCFYRSEGTDLLLAREYGDANSVWPGDCTFMFMRSYEYV